MSKIAFVFPGQGAQYVGMGKDIVEIKTTIGFHLDEEKKATNIKLSIFGLIIGAGSVISVIFL